MAAVTGAGGVSWPAGLDMFDKPQQPQIEPIDDLSRFVVARIRDTETEPRVDQVPQNHDKNPVAYRYAAAIRRDMVVFRNIVELYVEAMGNEDGDGQNYMGGAMLVVAGRFADHPDYQEKWRLE